MVLVRSAQNSTSVRSQAESQIPKSVKVHPSEPHNILPLEKLRFRKERNKTTFSAPQKKGCALWFIGLACAIAIIIVIGGIIATARIIITPKQFNDTIDISIVLSQSDEQGTLRFFTATKTFSKEQIIAAQSSVMKDSYATGTVRFYNALPQARTIPTKTLIRSSNADGEIVDYVTKNTVSIPGAKNKRNGYRDVSVIAEKIGSDANMDINDFVLVMPIAGITARSLTPMKGGTQRSDKVADPAAVAEAQATLLQDFSLADNMIVRMMEELPADMVALPVSFADSAPVISVESNHEDGVHVVARKTVAVTMVRRTDLARLLGDRLNVPKDIQLTLTNLDGVTITTSALASPRSIPSTISVRISGTPTLLGRINESAIKDAVRAKSRWEANANLASVAEIEHFSTRMLPFWRRILPVDPVKISITIR